MRLIRRETERTSDTARRRHALATARRGPPVDLDPEGADLTRRRAPLSTSLVGLSLVASACAADPPAAVVGLVIDNCDPGEEVGSGMIVGSGLVLTSAHVVAGARSIEVVRDQRRSEGTVVAFDPEMDLAYLSIDDWPVAPMDVASDHVDDGDRGVGYVVRHGEVVVLPITIRRRVHINTEDIYVQGETRRPGFELDADIEAGDSGGAVMVDGEVVGVLWARSRKYDSRAYAIDPVRAGDLVDAQLRTGEIGDDIDLTRCG